MAEEVNVYYSAGDWDDPPPASMKLSTDTVPRSIGAPVSLETEIIEVIDIDSDSDPEQDEGSIDKPDTIDESDIEDQGPDYEAYTQYVINAESGNDQDDIDEDSEVIQDLDFELDTDSTDYQTPRTDFSTQVQRNRKETVDWVSKSGANFR